MEIILDGKAIADELTGENLMDMLQDLAEKRLGDDLAIRELLINGSPYEEAVHGAPEEISRQAIQRLEIETIGTRDLALGFLQNFPPTLATLAEAIEKVAELFRIGDEQTANEEYLQFLEALEILLETLQQSSDALGLDMERIHADGVSAQHRLERLAGLTTEMLAAQEQDDWVLLADLLQYDLKPEMNAWAKLMEQMRRMALAC